METEEQAVCAAPACTGAADHGEDWSGRTLQGITQYRMGVKLSLTVEDIAVCLVLCDRHSRELTEATWHAATAKLSEWNWRPIGPRAG
jgi:hypothetical protein